MPEVGLPQSVYMRGTWTGPKELPSAGNPTRRDWEGRLRSTRGSQLPTVPGESAKPADINGLELRTEVVIGRRGERH